MKNDKIILIIIAIVSLLSFILILQNIYIDGKLTGLDNQINHSVQKTQSPSLIFISKAISAIFEPIIFVILLLIVSVYLFRKKRKKEAYALTWLAILSFSVSQLIKVLVHRPRPINALITENTFSFPSGHAVMAVIFFGTMIYLFEHHIKNKKTKQILTFLTAILVLLISFSRIILNVHWLSDILASFSLGFLILVLFVLSVPKTNIISKK